MILEITLIKDVQKENNERIAGYAKDGWRTRIVGQWSNSLLDMELEKDLELELKGTYGRRQLELITNYIVREIAFYEGNEAYSLRVYETRDKNKKLVSANETDTEISFEKLETIVVRADWEQVMDLIKKNS